MFSFLLLAQAASLGAGPVGIPGSWLSDGDYPKEAVRQKLSGPVEVDLSINEKGRVTACRVVVTSGHQILDAASCKFLPLRLRFKPALDETGRPIAAGHFMRFNWVLPGQRTPTRTPRAPDLILEIKQLTPGAKPMEVSLRMIQDADGSPVSCVISEAAPLPAINQAACRIAAPLTKLDPVVGASGSPVRNLRVRRLAFNPSK